MKILFINKFLHPNGGSETYIFKLGEELIRQGHEVQYFGMEHEGRIVGNHAEQYTDNIDFHSGGIKKLIYPFKIIYSREASKKLTKVLDDFIPDVIHLNNFNFQLTPSVIYASRKWEKRRGTKLKIVYTAHDGQLICPNHLMQQFYSSKGCMECAQKGVWRCASHRCIHGSFIRSILGSLEARIYRIKRTYRKIDTIISPSQFLKNRLCLNPDLNGRIIVRHNFISVFRDDLTDDKTTDKERYVLYFGRYSSEKGIQTLLKVCRETPEIQYRFIGSGPLYDEIIKLNNIRECGFQTGSKLYQMIRDAEFVIFPSECNENCPLSVMEALSIGVPVIASRIGGVPELIEDRVNGELFAPGDIKDLKEKISSLWGNKELLDEYKVGALNTHFLSVEEYVKELIKYVYNS